ncbi:MAG: hypothetical protein Q7S85_01055 [Rugosibacter sp.]|nr:hypothetical protein [Rugosibacter sp.]
MQRAAPLLVALVLAGCAQTGTVGQSVGNFDPKQIAKADIDRVADAHRREVFASVRVLAEKLYRRNPREWKKGGYASLDDALNHLLDPRTGWRLPALEGKHGTDAILLALSAEYSGDRVAAFIAGIGGMLNTAFDEKTEFFMLDDLDPQKLYNSARNLEIAAWKLANAKDAAGNLLLLSNEAATPMQAGNLSFEREFGKLIGNLDLLAKLIADKSNRTLARVTQSVATAVFLPVAMFR